jgi:hypothetical protein
MTQMKQGIISLGLLSLMGLPAMGRTIDRPAYSQPPQCPTASDSVDPVTIEGDVSRVKDQLLIQLSDNRIFALKSVKRQTQDDLNHLETGDHLIGLGYVQGLKKIIWMDDLEMVGVRRVLGNWKERSRMRTFEFRDFTSLNVSEGKSDPGVTINYRLVPDKKNQWTIFLSAEKSLRVGTMTYAPDRMNIQLVDLNSGSITEEFNLSPQREDR